MKQLIQSLNDIESGPGIVFPFAMWLNLIRWWKMKAGSLISVVKSELVTPRIVSSRKTADAKKYVEGLLRKNDALSYVFH